jgi:hypothetical protein
MIYGLLKKLVFFLQLINYKIHFHYCVHMYLVYIVAYIIFVYFEV